MPQSALITTSAYGITPSFKATGHVSALGITWLRCLAGKYRQKRIMDRPPSWSQSRACFPTIHFIDLDSDISLYTSFECQVKCTSNLESALSVTVHRITVQILIAAAAEARMKDNRQRIFGEFIILFNS